MIVNSACFVISNTDYRKCPSDARHEFAFIGRSNVGKSSLINMLTGQKALAQTSSTPGKTLLINHFLVNDQWYLVDLPGYGYAQRSKESRAELHAYISKMSHRFQAAIYTVRLYNQVFRCAHAYRPTMCGIPEAALPTD